MQKLFEKPFVHVLEEKVFDPVGLRRKLDARKPLVQVKGC
jgi:hypothetical protein